MNGNPVLFSNIGIGFGSSSSYGQIVISESQVTGALGGAIVPVFLKLGLLPPRRRQLGYGN